MFFHFFLNICFIAFFCFNFVLYYSPIKLFTMGTKTVVTSNKDWLTSGSGRTARIQKDGKTIAKGTGGSSKEAIRSANKKLHGR
jgi:hypothetical protein